ncbi:hypothetical protein ILUMI_20979 [Ignelater luminosus]|uniref:Uncharacterized protein n=1 Tax=Ignelater luminosus TaxID=2038154 RepID=A0A8K0G442_IGNLU|nr:hypothetical protein ILUMI_20979 [Ignelater luminosus]
MRILILLTTTIAFAYTLPVDDFENQWNAFKLDHGKVYASNLEEVERSKVFTQNLQRIKEHNEKFEKGLVSYKMGVTKFADLTVEEFRKQHLNGLTETKPLPIRIKIYVPPSNVTVPSNVDWRRKGAVTRVKDQLQCGSCWAFSAVGALEGQLFLKSGNLTSLSEQNLIDCSSENYGCYGGLPTSAYKYVIRNGGIDTEDAYPYLAINRLCTYDPRASKANSTYYTMIKTGSENDLVAAVAFAGPVSVAIDASTMQFYVDGIIDKHSCPGQMNHAVLAVGYGTNSEGKNYWILKKLVGRKVWVRWLCFNGSQ